MLIDEGNIHQKNWTYILISYVENRVSPWTWQTYIHTYIIYRRKDISVYRVASLLKNNYSVKKSSHISKGKVTFKYTRGKIEKRKFNLIALQTETVTHTRVGIRIRINPLIYGPESKSEIRIVISLGVRVHLSGNL